MRKEISDLVAREVVLQAKVDAAVANAAALKAALDAALQGQLTVEEAAALSSVSAGLASASQKISDSTAATNPSN